MILSSLFYLLCCSIIVTLFISERSVATWMLPTLSPVIAIPLKAGEARRVSRERGRSKEKPTEYGYSRSIYNSHRRRSNRVPPSLFYRPYDHHQFFAGYLKRLVH